MPNTNRTALRGDGTKATLEIEERAQRSILQRFEECTPTPLRRLQGVSRGPGAYGLFYTPKGCGAPTCTRASTAHSEVACFM